MPYIVYTLTEPNQTHPFYVGFSNNERRPTAHIREAELFIQGEVKKNHNFLKLFTISQILQKNQKPIINQVYRTNDRSKALQEEMRLIELYGRICKGTGILTNITAGGEGMRNSKDHWARGHTKQTHPGLKTMSETKRLRPQTAWNKGLKGVGAGETNPFFGKTHSDNTKSLLSNLAKERTGIKNSNAKTFVFVSPSGDQFTVRGDFAGFCKQQNLPKSSMRKVLTTGRPMTSGSATGWLVICH